MFCECGCGQQTNICTHTDKRRGVSKGQPRRFIHGHTRRRDAIERFWEKVCITETCWLWIGAKNRRGYGAFHLGTNLNKEAHRFAYETLIGDVPIGKELDHLCRNPSCIKTEHLEPVVHFTNVQRGDSPPSHNIKKSHCPRGHPYDLTNTFWTRRGGRMCKECNRQHSRDNYHKTRRPLQQSEYKRPSDSL